MGFYGYLVYGDAVGDRDHAGSITLNLPKNEFVAISARIVICLAILLSNPLQFYVAISIIFPNLIAHRVPENKHVLAEYLLRYSIIVICCKYIAPTSYKPKRIIFYYKFFITHTNITFGIF